MKPTIALASGRHFNLLQPESNQPPLVEDIAHALSNLCRFTGHTNGFYSVAQHSLYVSRLLPPELELAGLLHDAAEAFIGDVSSPLKACLPEYRRIEQRLEAWLAKHFGIPHPMPLEVKVADLRMLATEKRDLMRGGDAIDWSQLEGVRPADFAIVRGWPPGDAYQAWCAAFARATRSTKGYEHWSPAW